MSKHRSCKRALLVFAAMGATALASPSLASAASWGPIGTTHVLDSSDFELTIESTPMGQIGAACTETQLHLDVTSAANVTITNLGFPEDCHGTDNAVGCTVTAKATKLHWTMTAPTTDNVMIHGVHIDLRFETHPPDGNPNCPNTLNGLNFTITGTLRGGVWDPAEHELTFKKPSATGLVTHGPSGNNGMVTMSGTFRDTAQTLTLT